MEIEIWLDVVCPWCYIGKRRFESALERFEHADEVSVVLRSFELDPHAPKTSEQRVAEILADKYGGGLERAEGMIAHVTEVAAGEGLAYRLDIAQRANTFDAHRLIQLARDHDRQDAMAERVMRAYFTEGEPIGAHDTLVRLAAEAGLPNEETQRVLTSDDYADAVRSDERTAARLGIQGVPCIVFDRSSGLSGAQPPELVLEAMQNAWNATRERA